MRLPTHTQLLLPVIQVVEKMGGHGRARDVVEEVANHLEIEESIRNKKGVVSGREINLFARRVRWVRQDCVRRGWLSPETYGVWELTRSGRTFLKNIRPGFVVTIYETELGQALWAEAEAAAAVIKDDIINLIITSPEYPLVRPKSYGNRSGANYIDWLCGLATEWKRMLVDDGSLVLNVGPVWERGSPTESLYQERLLLQLVDEVGLHLAQRFYYHNPAKIPSSEWVTIRRVRVKNVVEAAWWLSKTANPKANSRKVLQPYSKSMLNVLKQGGERRKRRPSDHGTTDGAFRRDHGGAVPGNLLTATNSASSDQYHRLCREYGLPAHPATFADEIPEFFIKFLTEPGDLVYDPLAGSNKVGAIAERLNRRWLASEQSLSYLSGSKFRFDKLNNRVPHLCAI